MIGAGVGMGWDVGRVETKVRGAGEILGTTDPTLGTGEEIRGDIDGMAESCDRRVTSVPTDPPSPDPPCSPPVETNCLFFVIPSNLKFLINPFLPATQILFNPFLPTFRCRCPGGADGLVDDERAVLVSDENGLELLDF